MYAFLGVTCHLHFWQNDRGLSRATVVTRGGTDAEEESAQKVNSGEKNSPAGTRIRNLSITSLALLPTSYPDLNHAGLQFALLPNYYPYEGSKVALHCIVLDCITVSLYAGSRFEKYS